MYNQPYFIPGYYSSMAAPAMMRGAMNGAMLRGAGAAAGASRGLGLFSRLGSSLSAIRGINWGGFINNASKTLGVINQTIPLVRQVGPMFHNMKSMLRVASVFKDETDKNSSRRTNRFDHLQTNQNNYSTYSNHNNDSNQQLKKTEQSIYNDSTSNNGVYDTKSDLSPTFFIAS